jgi:hypothetical protein
VKSQTFYTKRIKPLVFMAVVTIICIVLTSSLYLLTRERVAMNELFFMRRSILDALQVWSTVAMWRGLTASTSRW